MLLVVVQPPTKPGYKQCINQLKEIVIEVQRSHPLPTCPKGDERLHYFIINYYIINELIDHQIMKGITKNVRILYKTITA